MTTDKNNSPVTAPMWWDGGDRAITAREKATIEEHGPSCYTVPLVPAQAVDPTDPWRGLYLPARMPAPSEYGDLTHPDTTLWPDDREDALDKLVHAQGFDFHIVAGDFTEEAMEDGDELYWQELRAWNPEAPEGEWRMAWKGDTEDGPYAWFVRPMALRPEPVALAATGKQQVGEVQWSALASLPLYRLADDANGNRGLHRDDTGSWVKLQDVERALAARQPGAQVPVATVHVTHGGFGMELETHIAYALPVGTHSLYAAPPAQGVDLGQFLPHTTPVIDKLQDVMATHGIAVPVRVISDAFRTALNEQRDAAPGVGNG